MKAKLTGLGILLLVILLAVGYTLLGRSRETAENLRLCGRRKDRSSGDEEVQNLIRKKYHLAIDYSRAGSSRW